MPRTLEIRDLDDEVYAGLVRHAADAGITVPELLRRHATRLAIGHATSTARSTATAWRDRTRRRASDASSADAIDALDEIRGAWPAP